MENVKKTLLDWLDSLYIPKSKKPLILQLKQYLDIVDVRHVSKEDEFKIGLSMLVIQTKGKGTRETFEDFKVYRADFNTIGKQYALVYIYSMSGGKPLRMDITSMKNLVII